MHRPALILVAVLVIGVTFCGPNEEKKEGGEAVPAAAPATGGGGGGEGGAALAADMIRDPLLWGPDYPAALRTVPALAKAGETRVEILPRRVVGSRKYSDRGAAERDAHAAEQAQAAAPPMRVPVGTPEGQRRKLPPVAAIDFPDDRSVRVGTPDHDAQYINVNARIEQVEQKWGKPDKVTEEVVDDGTERRPIALTLYHYANDAVIVVTSDINDPHAVDRVYLDAKMVMQTVF